MFTNDQVNTIINLKLKKGKQAKWILSAEELQKESSASKVGSVT